MNKIVYRSRASTSAGARAGAVHGGAAIYGVGTAVVGRPCVFVGGLMMPILVEAEQRLGLGRVGTAATAATGGLRFDS